MAIIYSYNVNGIRSAMSKGLVEWLASASPDIVCLQEIKAEPGQINLKLFEDAGYPYHYWHPARKRGYSGVAILSKRKPDAVEVGSGNRLYDDEGRILRADFGDVSVISLYMPSGTSGDERQDFKYVFMDFFHDYIDTLRKSRPNLIISGDWNIAHTPLDIRNAKSNEKNSGFLPEERAWLGKFLENGFIDSFRHFVKEPDHYSWWTFRANARARNIGWRIDYHMVTAGLESRLRGASILPDVVHSDHCPVVVELELK
jgi:exodeoxyribonuclease III